MLVLSRKYGETIHVGEDVTITIVEVDRQTVRIGIDAPVRVSIRRGELAKLDAPRRVALSTA